jgi:hypothetical protein
MHVHVCPWRIIIDLRLDVRHLVSVEIILALIPALLEQPVVGSRSRLVSAVHFFQLTSIARTRDSYKNSSRNDNI